MFFDIGWSEMLLIGGVALIVVGPKDLPRAMRVAGYWVRKARTMSRDFQGSIEQMIRESELDEMRQELKKVSEFDINREFQNTIDPHGSLASTFDPAPPPGLPDYSGGSPDSTVSGDAVAIGEPVADPPSVHGFEAASLPNPDPPPAHGFEPPPLHGFESAPGAEPPTA